EAQSAGVPVIAYGVGGSRDIITAEKTGLLFDKQTPESLLETMQQFETMRFNPFAIKKHAEKFSKQKFQEKIRKYVSQVNQQASSCRSAFCR
nr:D-inositol-3-phosphate glycosyltransferase [Chlamydiota bacterium]